MRAIQAKYLTKIRDKHNNIVGYTIMDKGGKTINIKADELKQLIKEGKVEVINLTLTSDNRLVDKAAPSKSKQEVKKVERTEQTINNNSSDYKLSYGRNNILGYFKFNRLNSLYKKGYINKQDLEYYKKDLAYKCNYGYVGNSSIGTVVYFTSKEGVITVDEALDYLDKVYTEHVVSQLKNKEDNGIKYDNLTDLGLEIKLCCRMLKLKDLDEYRKLVEGTLERAKTKLAKEKVYNNYRNIHRVYNYGYDKGIHDRFMIDDNIRCRFTHAWNGIMKKHGEEINKIEFKKEYNIKDFITILYKIGHISRQEINEYNKKQRDTIIKEITDYQSGRVVYAETLFASIMEFLHVQGKTITEYDLLDENQLYQGLLLMTANRNKLIDSELINVLSKINEKQEKDIKNLLRLFNNEYSFYVRDEYKHASGEVEKLIRDKFIKEKRVRHTAETMYDYLTTTGVIKDEYKEKNAQQLEDEEQAAIDKVYNNFIDKYSENFIEGKFDTYELSEIINELWWDSEVDNRPTEAEIYNFYVDADVMQEDDDGDNKRLKEEYRDYVR